MAKTNCPSCDLVVSVEQPRIGAMVTCAGCGQELEIISSSPFEVDYPLDTDWEDDGWEDEEN